MKEQELKNAMNRIQISDEMQNRISEKIKKDRIFQCGLDYIR